MTIEQISSFLNTGIFTLAEHKFTIAEIVLIPIIFVSGVWLTSKLASVITAKLIKRGTNADIVHLIKRILYVIALIVLAITLLDFLNVPITAFAFLSGAVAIGFGFGAQNIINNFISGWILMWERPIRIGDFLEVDGARGRVEEINTRSTRIRRVDGVHMLIPNSKLLENTVVNWNLVDNITRTSVRVGVAYGSNCKLVSKLIAQAVNAQDKVIDVPEPVVIFDDFGDSALVFEVYFWVNASVERDLRKIRSDVRFSIDELFSDNEVVISFPQRDVHIDGVVKITRQER